MRIVQGLQVLCFDNDVQVRILRGLRGRFFVSAESEGVRAGVDCEVMFRGTILARGDYNY